MADVKVKKPDGTWQSIMGPQGVQGTQGPAGSAGPQGPAGPGGQSITVFSQAGEPSTAIAGDMWMIP